MPYAFTALRLVRLAVTVVRYVPAAHGTLTVRVRCASLRSRVVSAPAAVNAWLATVAQAPSAPSFCSDTVIDSPSAPGRSQRNLPGATIRRPALSWRTGSAMTVQYTP